jgi:hypothetical protein
VVVEDDGAIELAEHVPAKNVIGGSDFSRRA